MENSDSIPAAVLIPLIELPFLPTEVLFTLRTDSVEHHKGQISFPGGVKEPEDLDLLQTALRECHEEIGLEPNLVEIIGELPETFTVKSGFIVKPYVGVVSTEPALNPNPHEIAEIIRVPIAHLLDSKNVTREEYNYKGVKYLLNAYHFGQHRIWGATARIVELLLKKIQPDYRGVHSRFAFSSDD